MDWRKRFERILRPPWQVLVSVTRRLTLGVRVLVVNDTGEVLLLRHTYTTGWELPGGGVERGELTGEAAARELLEEAGIRALDPPRLISVHYHRAFRGDHILFYRVDRWEEGEASDQGEIETVAWFPLDALPQNATAGARRRIGEALLGEPFDPYW